MGAGGVQPGRDPPAPAEVLLHECARTRVTRLFLPGRTVIRKEPLGPDADRRLRHELAMLQRLRGVAGVAQLVEAPRYPGSIVLADAGGTSLAGRAKPLDVDELIGLAVGLARAVAGMHAPGGDAPRHQPGQHRDLRRRRPVPGGLRVGDLVRRDPSGVHPPQPRSSGRWRTWRRSRPGAPAGRWTAGRSVRAGRDAVRAGHGCAAVRFRRPAAPHARSSGAGAGAAGRGEPGRARAVVRDHHASAGEGAGPPVPDRGGRGLRPGAGAGRSGASGSGSRCASASTMFRCGCCRRRGWWAATTRWRRWRRRSRTRWRAGAGGCWSAGRRGWARRRWSISCGRW